jgi:hypothetical protein
MRNGIPIEGPFFDLADIKPHMRYLSIDVLPKYEVLLLGYFSGQLYAQCNWDALLM